MKYDPELTEGENLIAHFLKKNKIKFVSQKRVKFRGDTVEYRIADFVAVLLQ